MARRASLVRPLVPVAVAALAAAGAVVTVPAAPALARAAVAPGHTTLVATVPKTTTPNVQATDGISNPRVNTIFDAGTKIIAGGPFKEVRSPGSTTNVARPFLFAFNESTGEVDTSFAPVVDDEVAAIIAGPTPGTVFIGGRFTKVNGKSRPKIALLNVADGSLVSGFTGPTGITGQVTDLALVGGRLLVGGSFTSVKVNATTTAPRNGLASFNATTGVLDDYLTVPLTVNHNWTPTAPPDTVAKAPVGVEKMAVSPDGGHLVVIGNFKKAGNDTHDQVVMLTLGSAGADISNWNTTSFTAACALKRYDSWVRDVAFSPDGEYFVIVGTGGPFPSTLCDSAARFEADASGEGQQPTWVDYTGGDTLLSVAISETAVYVGGHQRWLNNSFGGNNAQAGAVARPGIAALDPASGTPLAWNPGRTPRGFGTTEMYVTPQGLWIGYDQEWIGNREFKHDRIAFFPLAGGNVPHSTSVRSLPGKVYQFGLNPPNAVLFRVNAGGDAIGINDGGPDWAVDTTATPSPRHNAGTTAVNGRAMIATVKAPPVNGVVPPAIFSSDRSGTAAAPNLLWDFPVARGTTVQVRLYLASRCTCAVGSRKFHINIDGVRKASNYDITASVGNEVGTMLAYNVTSDGNIDVDLLRVAGFPVISGIEVVRLPTPAQTGQETKTWVRSYDGSTTASTKSELTMTPNGWWAGRGGFWVGGTLFYGLTNALYRRTFDGSTLGPATLVDPYHDPKWDTVLTDSAPVGQTYRGVTTNFFAEITSVTGMFYARGRIYYTLAGQTALFYRGFHPDAGVVGATRFTVTTPVNFAGSGGVFVSGSKLYMVGRTTGTLTRVDWVNGVPGGTPTVVSGPAVDGQDWRGKVVFVGP